MVAMNVDTSQADTPSRRTWSAARRAAQNGDSTTIPLLLSGRGQVGGLTIPSSLTQVEWDMLMEQIAGYGPGIVREDGDDGEAG